MKNLKNLIKHLFTFLLILSLVIIPTDPAPDNNDNNSSEIIYESGGKIGNESENDKVEEPIDYNSPFPDGTQS